MRTVREKEFSSLKALNRFLSKKPDVKIISIAVDEVDAYNSWGRKTGGIEHIYHLFYFSKSKG
jgi:hypothetical protein